MIGKKGQAAMMDAIFFMTVCAGASTLLFYTSGLYGSNTNKQIITIYNFEYAGTALVSLHYAKDLNGDWFWNVLEGKLASDPINSVNTYFSDVSGPAKDVWKAVKDSSPTQDVFLCFEGRPNFCYPNTPGPAYGKRTAYTSSVKLIDSHNNAWTVILKLYY